MSPSVFIADRRLAVSGCRREAGYSMRRRSTEKKKKKVSFCVSGFCVGNQKLSRFVCFLLEDYLSNQRAALWKQGSLFIIKGIFLIVLRDVFGKGKKETRLRVCNSLYFLHIS